MSHRSRTPRRLLPAALALALLLPLGALEAAPAAAASAEEGCTWLPDLRCGRSGRFDGFHKPIVAPYLFEDPFIATGAYPYYVWHDFPNRSVFQGGEIHVAALQLRLALTDRLALIATKDGRTWNRADNPLLDDTQGWLNIAGGLKYALTQDREAGWIVSSILRFEFDSGSSDAFQGYGDGMVLPSLAAAYALGDWRLIGDLGAQVPLDGGQQSTSLFYHLYASYDLARHFAPFAQLSGLRWVSSGDGQLPVRLKGGAVLPLDTVQQVLGTGSFEGADVANLGSRGVGGLDLVTFALGAHVPITDHVTFSVAYERPISGHKGIFEQRVTSALEIEF